MEFKINNNKVLGLWIEISFECQLPDRLNFTYSQEKLYISDGSKFVIYTKKKGYNTEYFR